VTLLDRFTDRTTRHEAAEVALVAHAALQPEILLERRCLSLSPAAVLVLDAILTYPAACRADLVAVVRVSLDVADADRELRGAVIRLATDAAALTVQDLAAVGGLGVIVQEFGVDRMQSRHLIHRRQAA
jgi:hypothetical protein